jgi:hypothetical protein
MPPPRYNGPPLQREEGSGEHMVRKAELRRAVAAVDKQLNWNQVKLAAEILVLVGSAFVGSYIFIVREANAQSLERDAEIKFTIAQNKAEADAGLTRLERKIDSLETKMQGNEDRNAERFFLLQKVILEGRPQPGLKPDAGGK